MNNMFSFKELMGVYQLQKVDDVIIELVSEEDNQGDTKTSFLFTLKYVDGRQEEFSDLADALK